MTRSNSGRNQHGIQCQFLWKQSREISTSTRSQTLISTFSLGRGKKLAGYEFAPENQMGDFVPHLSLIF